MVIQITAATQTHTERAPMFTATQTAVKTSILVVATIAAAHIAVFGGAAGLMQGAADHAMIPVLKAEPIIVRASSLQIVKADRIEVRAARAA